MYQFVVKNSGNKEQAEDIYHDAFIDVWQRVKLGEFIPATPSDWNGYLIKVARYKWINYLRSQSFKVESNLLRDLDEQQVGVEEDQIENGDERYLKEIAEHLKLMKRKCRDILRLFYYKKWSMKKIGDHLGITEASAKNGKYRCIESLRKQIKGEN